ncbi:hypothetical protein CDL15_Pgr001602 [Punica granatum]|uniref:NADP-dependent oxidoreductase domain-containing protein n=1 Tax=Punica granatum TaxID=22663 RepID=A0A218XB61_PUNGR|nr:hypothetical protein CDL15_Pgr001602 [Punica granatum]
MRYQSGFVIPMEEQGDENMAEDQKVQIPRVKLGTQGLEAIKKLPREKVQLATKFGVVKIELVNIIVNGKTEYVRSCCEASLKRHDADYIDLYYQHHVDTTSPLEETIRSINEYIYNVLKIGI